MAGTGDTSIKSYRFFLDITLAGGGTYAENAHQFIDDDSGDPFRSYTVQFANDGGSDLLFRFAEPYVVLNFTGLTPGSKHQTFEVGEPVVGGTSGAEGTITRVEDTFIHVDSITGGPFVAGEEITGLKTRTTATVNGAPGSAAAHGRIASGEVLTQDFRRETEVFFQGAGGLAVRFWAY